MPLSKVKAGQTTVDTDNISPSSLRLPTASSTPSGPQSGQIYFDTSVTETRVWNTNWKALDTTRAFSVTGLDFSSNSRFTRGAHTGQDGLARSNGKLTSPQISYSGASFATRFDADYDHILVLRYLSSGSPYVGLGFTIAPTITDSQAAVDPGNGSSFYAHQLPPHGASGATDYGMYFNQGSGYPSQSQVGYFYFFTDGSGSSRTFQIRWSSSYSTDYKTVGNPASGGSTNVRSWSNNVTVGTTNDIAIWLGEAGSLTEWRIERYSRSV